MLRSIFFVIVALLSFFSVRSHATDYYWTADSNGIVNAACGNKPDPTSEGVCGVPTFNTSIPSSAPWTFTHIVMTASNSANVWATDKNGTDQALFGISRSGTACPIGKTFNLVTGACDVSCTIAGQTNNSMGACVCPSPQVVVGAACGYDCSAGNDTFFIQKPTGTALNLSSPNQCINHCAVTLTAAHPIGPSPTQNCGPLLSDPTKTNCFFDGTRTGSACSSSLSGSGAQSIAVSPTTVTATPTTPASTTTTTVTTPASVAAQAGITVAVTSSSTSAVNPDGSITTTTTTATTTTNPNGTRSTSTVVGTSTSPNGNGKGEGTGAGTGSGTGSGSSGACDPTATTYDDCIAGAQTAVTHTTGTASTFGGAAATFFTNLKATPLGALASGTGIGGTVSVGTCPAPTLEFFGHSYPMTSMCTIFDGVSSALSTIMNVVYVVSGILIILSA